MPRFGPRKLALSGWHDRADASLLAMFQQLNARQAGQACPSLGL